VRWRKKRKIKREREREIQKEKEIILNLYFARAKVKYDKIMEQQKIILSTQHLFYLLAFQLNNNPRISPPSSSLLTKRKVKSI
jgi:hypothetical protein